MSGGGGAGAVKRRGGGRRGRGLWLGLLAGAACAIAVACGGARGAMAPTAAEPPSAMPSGDPRAELDRLSAQIDADLAALGIARPPVPAGACVQPPCSVEALSVQPAAAPASPGPEPACQPGPGEVCQDACRLSESICDSAVRICRIAAELGGGDAYANERCASGRESCTTARTRCCGCQ